MRKLAKEIILLKRTGLFHQGMSRLYLSRGLVLPFYVTRWSLCVTLSDVLSNFYTKYNTKK